SAIASIASADASSLPGARRSRATHEKNQSARQIGAVAKEPSPARPSGGRRFRPSTQWTSAVAFAARLPLSESREDCLEVGGERRLELERASVPVEHDARAMQERPVEEMTHPEVGVRPRVAVAVIADDGMADRGEVTA